MDDQDKVDHQNLMELLENKLIPLYYQDQKQWVSMMKTSMKDIYPAFDSDRMVKEYYEKLYV